MRPYANGEVFINLYILYYLTNIFAGFLVVNHGLDDKLQKDMFSYAEKFFKLPIEIKERVHLHKGGAAWRGYMPFGGERSQAGQLVDCKEG